MLRFQLATALLSVSLVNLGHAEETSLPLKDETDRINYTIGHQIGSDFVKQKQAFNASSLNSGLTDGYEAKQRKYDADEMAAALSELKRKISSDMRQEALKNMNERKAKTEKTLKAGDSFMDDMRSDKSVVELPSGLLYKEIISGTGAKPKLNDRVKVHYSSKTIDGKEYNSSHRKGEPYDIPVRSTLKGVAEGLQLMPVGAKWQLYVPPHLAYGREGPLAHNTIIVEIELLNILKTEN